MAHTFLLAQQPRMLSVTGPIHRGPSHCTKGMTIDKKEVKLSSWTNDMIICAENLKEFTKPLLEPRIDSNNHEQMDFHIPAENNWDVKFKHNSINNTDKNIKYLYF